MSDTPETDAVVARSCGQWSYDLRSTCRRLERQRDAYAETLRELANEPVIWLSAFIRERHPELASGSGEGSSA